MTIMSNHRRYGPGDVLEYSLIHDLDAGTVTETIDGKATTSDIDPDRLAEARAVKAAEAALEARKERLDTAVKDIPGRGEPETLAVVKARLAALETLVADLIADRLEG